MHLKCDAAHQLVLTCICVCAHASGTLLKSSQYIKWLELKEPQQFCAIYISFALKSLITMLDITISYKINTHKRDLSIYESFWICFINKSVITSQKFTLTKDKSCDAKHE